MRRRFVLQATIGRGRDIGRRTGFQPVCNLNTSPSSLLPVGATGRRAGDEGQPTCGVASPERPTTLVEGGRYDTSVAAAVIDAKWHLHLPIYRQQDIFAGSGWVPSRSTLNNLILRAAFVVSEFLQHMKARVQNDVCIGLDDTRCRMLMP